MKRTLMLLVLLAWSSFALTTTTAPTFGVHAQSAQTTLIPSLEVEFVNPDGWFLLNTSDGRPALTNDKTTQNETDSLMTSPLTATQSVMTFLTATKELSEKPQGIVDRLVEAKFFTEYKVNPIQLESSSGVPIFVAELTSLQTNQVAGAALLTDSPYKVFHMAVLRSGSVAQYAKDKPTAWAVAASFRVASTARLAAQLPTVPVQADPTLLTQDKDIGPVHLRLPADFHLPEGDNLPPLFSALTSSLAGMTTYSGKSSYASDSLVLFVFQSRQPGVREKADINEDISQMSGGMTPYRIDPFQMFNLNGRMITVTEGEFATVSLMALSLKTENNDLITFVVWLSGSVPAKPFTDYERRIIYSIAGSLTSSRQFDSYADVQAASVAANTNPTAQPAQLPAGQPIRYGQTVNVTIPGKASTVNLIFSGKKGQAASAEVRIDDKVISMNIFTANGSYFENHGPHYPFYFGSGILPADGDYYLQVTNFEFDEVTVPVTLSLLTPDNRQTTNGALTIGKAVSAYIDNNETDTWVFKAKAGQKYTMTFSGLGDITIRGKGTAYYASRYGWEIAKTPYELDAMVDDTVTVEISSILGPEVYTLKVSQVGQADTSPQATPTAPPVSMLATPAEPSTLVPTATESASPTVAAAGGTCPGSPPQRLTIGGKGRVTPGLPNWINSAPLSPRQHPGKSRHIVEIPPGGVFDVLDGPQCADGITWWKVKYHGYTGWTGESDSDYWVEPVN